MMILRFGNRWIRVLQFGAVVLALFGAGSARATLGGSVDSVEADRAALSAVRRVAPVSRDGYSVHELDSGGTFIREYVSASGVVFGIAWNGLTHPNLNLLLGPYSADYLKADQSQPRVRGRRARFVQGDQVAVGKWGHMRNLQGRAYLPSRLPAGVSPDAIR